MEKIKIYIEKSLYIFGLLLLFAVLTPYINIDTLFIDIISHFQSYYIVATILLFALTIVFRIKKPIIYINYAVAILILFITFLPYIKTSSSKVIEDNISTKITVMQANVFKFNSNYDEFIKQIIKYDPDIITLAETTPKWSNALDKLQKEWPHKIDDSRLGSHGMLIFSKYPIINKDIKYFSIRKIPTIFFTIKKDDVDINFTSIHPLPPVCRECYKSRNRNFTEVAKLTKNTKTIIVGDMNTTMFSPAYRGFIKKINFINSRNSQGFYPTWPTTIPNFMRIPIDHILHSRDIKTISFKTLENNGSDHLPTIAKLAIVK